MHPSPYSESVYNEGPGFRLGSSALVLHPGFAADFGYDSNVFYNPVATGSGLMRLRAHLDLATLPPQYFEGDSSSDQRKVDFRFSTQVEYREYLTSNSTIESQRSVNIYASPSLTLFPKGPFKLVIADDYLRTVDPRNFETVSTFTRDYNRAAVTGSYKSPGETLEIGVGDYFQLGYYETGPGFGNTWIDEAQLFAKWRLLPRSVLSATFRVGWVDYYNNPTINSIPFRGVVGFSTLLSTWFGFSVTAGYGNSFNTTGPSYSNFVGGAELRFFLPYRSTITLNYDRDFFDSLFANYFVDDAVGLVYMQPLLRWLSARVEGGVRFRHYDGLTSPAIVGAIGYSTPTRDDIIYTARAELNFRARSWLEFGVSYNLLADQTDFAFLEANGMAEHVNYIKHSVFGRFDIAY